MKKLTLFLVLFLGIVAALVLVSQANAQSPAPTPQPAGYPTDNDVNLVAKKLYCPVCPNTPLDVCETQACKDWRAQIRQQLADGWSEQQVIAYFVEQYGERVLAEPERKGFTSLVWILPVILTLLGFAFVWIVLRGWLKKRAASSIKPVATVNPNVSPEVLAKIEAEIRKIG